MVVELFLIGVALSMDAFAVSMCKGLSMRKLNHKHAFVISLFFGGFQAIMPLIGWFRNSVRAVHQAGGSLGRFCTAGLYRH